MFAVLYYIILFASTTHLGSCCVGRSQPVGCIPTTLQPPRERSKGLAKGYLYAASTLCDKLCLVLVYHCVWLLHYSLLYYSMRPIGALLFWPPWISRHQVLERAALPQPILTVLYTTASTFAVCISIQDLCMALEGNKTEWTHAKSPQSSWREVCCVWQKSAFVYRKSLCSLRAISSMGNLAHGWPS